MSPASPPVAAPDRRAFVLRRLMSLTGVVPLGVFVLAHLLAMAQALRGPEAFGGALAHLTPLRLWLEALLIGVPLLVHAGLGLALVRRARLGPSTHPHPGHLAWFLQRVSGIVVLLFLLLHVYETRVALLLGERTTEDLHSALAASLSSTGPMGFPFHAAGYLIGVAATVYHLANGVVGFSASFGLVTSAAKLRRVEIACALGGALVFLLSVATVLHLATGSASPWGST